MFILFHISHNVLLKQFLGVKSLMASAEIHPELFPGKLQRTPSKQLLIGYSWSDSSIKSLH